MDLSSSSWIVRCEISIAATRCCDAPATDSTDDDGPLLSTMVIEAPIIAAQQQPNSSSGIIDWAHMVLPIPCILSPSTTTAAKSPSDSSCSTCCVAAKEALSGSTVAALSDWLPQAVRLQQSAAGGDSPPWALQCMMKGTSEPSTSSVTATGRTTHPNTNHQRFHLLSAQIMSRAHCNEERRQQKKMKCGGSGETGIAHSSGVMRAALSMAAEAKEDGNVYIKARNYTCALAEYRRGLSHVQRAEFSVRRALLCGGASSTAADTNPSSSRFTMMNFETATSCELSELERAVAEGPEVALLTASLLLNAVQCYVAMCASSPSTAAATEGDGRVSTSTVVAVTPKQLRHAVRLCNRAIQRLKPWSTNSGSSGGSSDAAGEEDTTHHHDNPSAAPSASLQSAVRQMHRKALYRRGRVEMLQLDYAAAQQSLSEALSAAQREMTTMTMGDEWCSSGSGLRNEVAEIQREAQRAVELQRAHDEKLRRGYKGLLSS